MPVGVKPEGAYSVAAARYIETPGEARLYYQGKFARRSPHEVTCRGRSLLVEFEYDATHLFSMEPPLPVIPPGLEITRRLRNGVDRRQFCLERARDMDLVLATIRKPALTHRAHEGSRMANWVIYGFPPASGCGYRLLVALRPSSGGTCWACISAYRVKESRYQAVRAMNERFPP